MLGDRRLNVGVELLHRLAGEIAVAVEEREGSLFGRQRRRGEIGLALDRLEPALGQRDGRRRAVAHAAHDERVGKAGDAEPDAPLRLRFDALLLQRKARGVDDVVHHAHGERHELCQLVEIEPRRRLERIAHQAREVDRTEEAGAVGRQRLLAAIMGVDPVRIEGVEAGDPHVEHLGLAIGLDRRHRGEETLGAGIGDGREELRPFRRIADPALHRGGDDRSGKTRRARSHDGERVVLDRRGDAEAEQHALQRADLIDVAGDQLDPRAVELGGLVEEPGEKPAIERARAFLEIGGDRTVGCVDAERLGCGIGAVEEVRTRSGGARTAAARAQLQSDDGGGIATLDPALLDAVQRQRVVHGAKLRPLRPPRRESPDRSLGKAPAEEISQGHGERPVIGAGPGRRGAVIVDDDEIAGAEPVGAAPLAADSRAGAARRGQHLVIAGQTQRVAFARRQAEDRLPARREKAIRARAMRLPVDQRDEFLADQLGDLKRPFARLHPGIGGNARIGRVDLFAVSEVVAAVDAVDEDDAGLGIGVGRPHDLVPELARRQHLVGRAGEFELPRRVFLDRGHEGVGDEDREVEHAQPARLALRLDEGLDVGMVAAQRPHHGAAAVAGAHDGSAHRVPHIHEGERPRGVGADALHRRALGPQRREVVTDAAALLHGQRGFAQMGEDPGHVVRHGAHDEAVEERDAAPAAGAGDDAPGGQEAEAFERLAEARGPLRAHRVLLRLGKSRRDALPGILDRLVERLAVRPLEPVFHVPDLLRDRGDARHASYNSSGGVARSGGAGPVGELERLGAC